MSTTTNGTAESIDAADSPIRQKWATVTNLTFEEMLEALLLIDERWYPMFAYEMARLIATSKQFDDAVPLGQAVIHDFIAAGQMHAKLSDHGVESSEKALRLVIFSENTPLSDVTATQTRKQMHASIALKRAACKKALRMCGEGAAEEPLPPYITFLYFYDGLKEMQDGGALSATEPEALSRILG